MSKNITSASNYNRDSAFLSFTSDKNETLVGNNQPLGSVTISELYKGVDYSNVQSALNSIQSLYTVDINSVMINTDGINPAGVSQYDSFKFVGTATDSTKQIGDKLKFNFYGLYVDVLNGDSAEEVASKVKSAIEAEITKTHVFNTVAVGQSLDTITVSYIDYNNHTLTDIENLSVTVEYSNISPAKSGYGTWKRLGTQTLTLDGASEPVTLHYFKRIS